MPGKNEGTRQIISTLTLQTNVAIEPAIWNFIKIPSFGCHMTNPHNTFAPGCGHYILPAPQAANGYLASVFAPVRVAIPLTSPMINMTAGIN